MHLKASLFATVQFLMLLPLGRAADECQPYTRGDKPDLGSMPSPRPEITRSVQERDEILPGDVVCRAWGETDEEVNHHTCTDLAEFYWMDVAKLFKLNPILKTDCSSIQPNTEYCTDGWIEPVGDKINRCGPLFGNAPCAYSDNPCCNSETWTCGATAQDCADGICYEGFCAGDAVYTTNGKCGVGHGMRQCAGKWGDCCSMDGECGSGPDFCGADKCQTGNCAATPLPTRIIADGISGEFLVTLGSYTCDFKNCPLLECACTGPTAEPAADA
ncbi:hypothetical protein CMUS01_12043 [Colletotrichum musicola]|uniref:Chitin-binding type-1 domain-containing protein n=1 Tax=Colletotrichum musicola TaxID=2175873 RepID=A0A8H6N2A1_9PEZI|nr:hypothetical protein CMUS01_12043 [Colletotrichum musicola]